MASVPAVSVIMPVYNAERYLRLAMDSILTQTFGDLEFVIVEDASTDRSLDIIRSYGDPRIRLLQNPGNLGVTASLNRGLDAARGALIARMDADDVSETDRLGCQVAFLRNSPECIVLGTQATIVDDRGNVIGRSDLLCEHDQIVLYMLYRNQFYHGSVMFRTSDDLRYDPRYPTSQDYDLWSRLGQRGRLANTRESLYRWRYHAGTVSVRRRQEQVASAAMIAAEHAKRLESMCGRERLLRAQEIGRDPCLAVEAEAAREELVRARFRSVFTARGGAAARQELAAGHFEASHVYRRLGDLRRSRHHALKAFLLWPFALRYLRNLAGAILRRGST